MFKINTYTKYDIYHETCFDRQDRTQKEVLAMILELEEEERLKHV